MSWRAKNAKAEYEQAPRHPFKPDPGQWCQTDRPRNHGRRRWRTRRRPCWSCGKVGFNYRLTRHFVGSPRVPQFRPFYANEWWCPKCWDQYGREQEALRKERQ